jgi:multidrug efflux system outer membrane protein
MNAGMKSKFKFSLARSASLTFAIAFAGCAVGPDFQKPHTDTAATFSAALFSSEQATADTPYNDAEPIAEFWTIFGDDTLNKLIVQALQTNHDLRIAAANLDVSRALRRGAQADYLPTLNAQAAHEKSRFSVDEINAGAPQSTTLNTGSIDAFWELDIFGRVRRNNEAARANEEATREDLHGVQISIAAEIARNYLELRGAQELFAVAQRNADNQQQTLRILEARVEAGRGTDFDTARAQALLNTTLSNLPILAADIAALTNRLSVLVGQQPRALADQLNPVTALPELPRLVNIGKPEDLLRRRPDVRAAERRLALATANIGVAQADWFPRVSFTGEIGFVASSTNRIGDADTATYRYGPGISWAALDFTHVRARVQRSRADADASLAGYEQTALHALEETENALTRYGATRQQLDFLRASAEANTRAAKLAYLRFENGSIDFLEVLDIERTRLETEASHTRARTATATGLIAVYKALGGGWRDVNSVAMK